MPYLIGALALPGSTPSPVPRPAPQPVVSWSGRCFNTSHSVVTSAPNGPNGEAAYTVTISVANPLSSGSCDEIYLLGTMTALQLMVFDKVGSQNVTITVRSHEFGFGNGQVPTRKT